MNNIISVKVGSSFKKIFLQNGFYRHNIALSPLHSHNYSEIHSIISGKAKFFIENKEYLLEAGSILIIPPKTFHWVIAESDDATSIAFQIDHSAESLVIKNISPHILSGLAEYACNQHNSQNANYNSQCNFHRKNNLQNYRLRVP